MRAWARSWRSVRRSTSRTDKSRDCAHAGVPAGAQQGGSGGGRTSKEAMCSFRRQEEVKRSGLCEDAGAFLEKRAEKHFQNK